MIKMIGAAVILFAAFLLGYLPLYRMKQRMAALTEWISALEMLYLQLHTNLLPIPVLFAQQDTPVFRYVGERLAQCGAASFPAAWRFGVETLCPELSYEEKRCIGRLGDILGNCILEDELDVLSDVLIQLRQNLQEIKAVLGERRKLYMGASMSLGMILVVVFF